MAVYFIVDTMKVTDPQMLAEYSQRAAPTLEQYGVKFLVSGSAPHEIIEGNWQTQGVAILEFEDREHFKRWYDSPEYKDIRMLRIQSTFHQALLIQGKQEDSQE